MTKGAGMVNKDKADDVVKAFTDLNPTLFLTASQDDVCVIPHRSCGGYRYRHVDIRSVKGERSKRLGILLVAYIQAQAEKRQFHAHPLAVEHPLVLECVICCDNEEVASTGNSFLVCEKDRVLEGTLGE